MATTIPRHVGRRSCMGVAQSRSCCKLFFIPPTHTLTVCFQTRLPRLSPANTDIRCHADSVLAAVRGHCRIGSSHRGSVCVLSTRPDPSLGVGGDGGPLRLSRQHPPINCTAFICTPYVLVSFAHAQQAV